MLKIYDFFRFGKYIASIDSFNLIYGTQNAVASNKVFK